MPYTIVSLGNETPPEKPVSTGGKGFTITHVPGQESTLQSGIRTAIQPALGFASKFTYPADLVSLAATGESLAELEELDEARLADLQKKFGALGTPKGGQAIPSKINREKYLEALESAQQTFPTQHNIENLIEQKTGAPLQPRNTLQKMGRLGGMAAGFQPGNANQKAISGIAAPLVSQGAQVAGVPESLADLLGLGASSLRLKPGATKKATEALTKAETEKFPSGLTKPRALASEYAEQARISPQAQEEAISKLNKEAEHLTTQKYIEHFPISKQIEEGFDFEGNFKKEFSELNHIAKKHNAVIDIKPISELLEKTFEKYHGVVTPHPDAKKILHEAQKFAQNPQAGLEPLLKNFRSNNAKRGAVLEQRLAKGYRPEYSGWLREMNDAIMKSIKTTLPENSAFVKRLELANSNYSNYKKALEAKKLLEPVLGGELTPVRLKKLATDPKIARKLEFATNKKTTDELIQIAKDLKAAHEGIKRIPVREMHKWENLAHGAGFLFGGPLGKVFSLGKGKDFAQRAYGYVLLNPSSRREYQKALKALAQGDKKSYETAMKTLAKSLRGHTE